MGPFRLVLDTGANRSAVTAAVAQTLGIPLNSSTPITLRGVTGTATVPTVRVDTFIVGDMQLNATVLPIVPDALGGAEGVLGTEGLTDKRIFIDFRHDKITISHSHMRRADRGFVTIPVRLTDDKLLIADVRVGTIKTKAIIDTGGQATVANLALRYALTHRRAHQQFTHDEVTGATDDVQQAEDTAIPPIDFNGITIQGARVTVGDLQIFDDWKLKDKPVMLIGMDTLGLLDTLVIDYRRHELQIRIRETPEIQLRVGSR
jgi:predicted aspartyl protease